MLRQYTLLYNRLSLKFNLLGKEPNNMYLALHPLLTCNLLLHVESNHSNAERTSPHWRLIPF